MPNKAFNIVKNPKYDLYQRGLASINYKCFDKKNFWWCHLNANKLKIKNENISNKELGEELHKPFIRKFEKRKYAHLLETIFEVLILPICN